MSVFSSIFVAEYMSTNVVSVLPGDSLATVDERLREAQVSCLAVVDQADVLVGVISRTDLLRQGRARNPADRASGADLLAYSRTLVEEAMTRDVALVDEQESVAAASRLMCERRVHRVFVTSDGRLAGVFSTLDVMAAIVDAVSIDTIALNMSTPVVVVDVAARVVDAADLLVRENVSGLIVVENEWPIGVFTQVEALAGGDLGSEALVEDAMDPALICMPAHTPMHRAAQQAIRMRVRRVVVADKQHMRGILSGLDFAAFVARA